MKEVTLKWVIDKFISELVDGVPADILEDFKAGELEKAFYDEVTFNEFLDWLADLELDKQDGTQD